MNLGIYYKGLASTPTAAGVIDWDTNAIIEEINTSKPTGKGTRAAYEKAVKLLKSKYGIN